MRRFALAGLILLGSAPTLSAQAAVLSPEKSLGAERTRLRDTVYVMRDSLAEVSAAVARLGRDFRGASPQVLASRARTLASDCRAARRLVPSTRAMIASAPISTKPGQDQQKRAADELSRLESELDRCVQEFEAVSTPEKGEEVRGYGNRKAAPILAQIRRYDAAIAGLFRVLAIPHRPLGARENPLAS